MMGRPRATNGPEEILPSNEYFTTEIDTPVNIRSGDTEVANMKPMSVPGLFAEAVAKYGDKPAIGYKKNPSEKGFHFISYRKYMELSRVVAKAFLKLGLERFQGVGIIGFNAPEWFLTNMGAIHAGGISMGMYTTNSAEAVCYCLKRGNAAFVVTEDDGQTRKVLQVKDKLPGLKNIIQYTGKPPEGVLSWEEFLDIGRKESDDALEQTLKTIAINQCCSLIYTSGTTGNPKGVMLSHDNLTWNVRVIGSVLDAQADERVISYLPLSHVAAQCIDIYCSIKYGATVYFANRDALKGGLLGTLQEVKPTRFLGVPRVWEKIAEKMMSVSATAGFITRTIATWAKNQGLQRNMDLTKGVNNPSLGYIVARALIFSRVRARLGLEHCRSFLSGAAPLSEDTKKYFASLDILVADVFGMSESSGPHTFLTEAAFRFNSIGRSLPGTKTKITNLNEERQGEVCLYGRNLFMGYLNEKEKTDETFDENGWLRTGDLGKIDKDGFVSITGRLKELLITSGGENISPLQIEQNVKVEIPCLGQAVVVCDRKKFLSILLTFSCEADSNTGEPLDELTDLSKAWLRSIDCNFTTVTQVIESGPDKKVLDAIQQAINAANAKAISNAQKIQKFTVLPRDFSVATGELGPTMKLRRNVVNQKYKDIIDAFYE